MMKEKRIELRTNNYTMPLMLSKSNGYGFCEERHYGDEYLHLALDSNGDMWEISHQNIVKGPSIVRQDGIRGRCDTEPMMYVKEDGVKFLYKSKYRPLPRNRTQMYSEANKAQEKEIIQEYAKWRGGEYLPPELARKVNSQDVYDDGGVRYFEKEAERGKDSFENLMNKFAPSLNQDEWSELPSPPPPSAGGIEDFIQRFANVTEEYKFYNDTITIRYDKEEHKYFRLGELGNLIPLAGVTTVAGRAVDKSMMLTPWAAKMMFQKLLRLVPTYVDDNGCAMLSPISLAEFTVIALEAKSAHKDKLDEASDTGHAAHLCLEDSIKFAIANDPDKIVRSLIKLPEDERAKTAAGGGFNWMQAHNVRWRETETKVFSREHDYAGTMDGLAVCDSCNDEACCPVPFKDELCLIDWKSSNSLKIEYRLQVQAYRRGKMEEKPELKITHIFLLRLGKDEEEAGKFEPWHITAEDFEDDWQAFLICLNLVRLMDRVEERMKAQKGRIRSIRKVQRETAKAIAKEQAKLQKALEKAAAKVEREKEKLRIKAEAKAERERLKKEKKCTSTEQERTMKEPSGSLSDTTPQALEVSAPSSRSPEAQTEKTLQPESTTSTEEAVPEWSKMIPIPITVDAETYDFIVKQVENPPEPNEALKNLLMRPTLESQKALAADPLIKEIREKYKPKFDLPMEG